MFKNVATKIALFAFDTTTGAAKTGDSANLTAYVSKDYGAVTVLTDTTATEMDSTNAKGWYLFDVAQAESNADALLFTAKSSTANISVVGQYIHTTPNRFTTLVIDAAGLADANTVKLGPTGAGTAQTARDIGASVLLSSGTGTGQLSITSGIAKVDVDTIKTNPVVNAGTVTFPTGATLASTTNITAGTITTATNVTTVNGLAANVITAAATASDFGTEIATAIWQDATAGDFTVASSIGKALYTGNIVPGAAGGLFIAGSNAATTVNITGNITGNLSGSVGSVTGAVGSVTGAVGSVTGNVGGNVTGSVGSVAAGGITASSIAADAIGASELAADAVAEIADAVWDEVLSGHLTAGTTGNALNAAGSAGDPWSTALPGAYGAGTAGKIIGDNINATISSRASQTSVDTIDDFVDTEVSAIKTKTDQLTFTVANQVDVNVLDWKSATAPAMTGDAYARLGAPAGVSVSADIAAVKSDSGAIKTKTDSLTFTVAGMVDSNVIDWKGATAPAMTGDAYARLGAPAGASVSADVAAIKAQTAAIETDTTEIGVAGAGLTVLATAAALNTVDDFLDTEIAAIKAKTDSLTFTKALELDVNIQSVNGTTVTGDGSPGTEWGP